MATNFTSSVQWGGRLPPTHRTPIAVTSSGQAVSGGSATPSNGPGQTNPRGSYGDRGRSQIQSSWQQQQNQSSGQPLEVSSGVWVYPNGQRVTGSTLSALNSASTVLPSSMSAENNTLLAEEQAATAAATVPAATTTTTSYFSESTIYPPYTNGQVLLIGGGAAVLLYLFMGRRR